MSCFITCKRIVIGKTKKKALITVCKNCNDYGIPHFNYISKKYEVTFSLLSSEFVDTFENIELEDRTDTEEFLNTIVAITDVKKTNKTIRKLNKQFFRKQKIRQIKHANIYATLNEGSKYFEVDIADIEPDMTYWELIVKLWNKNNEEKTPNNLLKPYYRNFIEYIDTATFGLKKHLNGGTCYTKQDQERTPHFIYKVPTGEEFAILFEKAEYLQPTPRKLTQKELDVLVKFLNTEYKIKEEVETYWQSGVWLWNNQNYEYNEYSPKWFPKYKKIADNVKMPDYTKLNN